MLNKIFNMENPFWTFANKLADVVILELLWILTSLPLFTAGASSSAFWHVALRLAEDTEGRVTKNYFTAFKRNFKAGTIVWLIQLAAALWIFLDAYICFKSDNMATIFLLGFFLVLGVFWLMTSMFLYPLIGRFDFSVKKIIGNSAFLSLKHFPHTLCLILLPAAAFAASCYFQSGFLFIALPALAFYLDAMLYNAIFSLYMEESRSEDET